MSLQWFGILSSILLVRAAVDNCIGEPCRPICIHLRNCCALVSQQSIQQKCPDIDIPCTDQNICMTASEKCWRLLERCSSPVKNGEVAWLNQGGRDKRIASRGFLLLFMHPTFGFRSSFEPSRSRRLGGKIGSEFLGKRTMPPQQLGLYEDPFNTGLKYFLEPLGVNDTENEVKAIMSQINLNPDRVDEKFPEYRGKRMAETDSLIQRVLYNELEEGPIDFGKRGSEFLGKRAPGNEFLGKRGAKGRMGNEFLGKRNWVTLHGNNELGNEFIGKNGSKYFGKRGLGREFLGKRGVEFLGKRGGNEFLGKRGSEFLGKRGSEFLGKRGSEFLGKRGSEFLGKRSREFLGKRGTTLATDLDSNFLPLEMLKIYCNLLAEESELKHRCVNIDDSQKNVPEFLKLLENLKENLEMTETFGQDFDSINNDEPGFRGLDCVDCNIRRYNESTPVELRFRELNEIDNIAPESDFITSEKRARRKGKMGSEFLGKRWTKEFPLRIENNKLYQPRNGEPEIAGFVDFSEETEPIMKRMSMLELALRRKQQKHGKRLGGSEFLG